MKIWFTDGNQKTTTTSEKKSLPKRNNNLIPEDKCDNDSTMTTRE